jgi:hypothetical protein
MVDDGGDCYFQADYEPTVRRKTALLTFEWVHERPAAA